jgi:hypothetical protein
MRTTESPGACVVSWCVGFKRESARRTSDKQHLALLLDGADGGLAGVVVVVFVGDENGFFDVAEDEVAVRVVGLAGC